MLELDDGARTGEKPQPQTWQGFHGWKVEGLFFGTREHDVLLCLSGARSNALALSAIAASTNVSRIDFQVTFCTNGEQLDLAHETFTKMSAKPKGVGRPRSFKLILGHPEGQTFYLNRRVSDNFGRIYDKGVEGHLAPKGMVWRYEVEFKRKVAKQQAAILPPREQLSAYVSDLVRSWWTSRDVEPPWGVLDTETCFDNVANAAAGDVLTWYDKSVSVSIARSIKRFGLSQVLKALHLQELVSPIGGKHHGGL